MHWKDRLDGQLCIAVDMDEVLVDTLGKMIHDYNQQFGMKVVPSDMFGQELADIVPDEHRAWVLGMLHQPGYFSTLEPMPGALEIMREICDRHRVYVASAALEFPSSLRDKMEWVARYLPQIPMERLVFCGEKFLLDVDYLLDDTPSHFAGLRGRGLLFDAPHNRTENRYPRIANWWDVPGAIDASEAAKVNVCS